ncbi:MAG: hypothetical protein HC774_01945, partial [Sphingomonadales bacterium]|nr:hypothetical protein [Sphingomonadales bacterium]
TEITAKFRPPATKEFQAAGEPLLEVAAVGEARQRIVGELSAELLDLHSLLLHGELEILEEFMPEQLSEDELEARQIALELWTLVHGAACLVIDEDYEKVAPGLDAARLIAEVTPKILSISS